MDNINDPVKDLAEIRSMMEKSSKFLSLSGLAGISAGIIALIGSYAMLLKIREIKESVATENFSVYFISVALVILALALGAAIFFTTRNAKKKNLPVWTPATNYLLTSLFLPLLAGGLFSFILWYRGNPELIFSATLVFYGLALLNASKYTSNEIRYLAIIEIILGLVAGVSYGLILWAVGFGVMHIIYGIYMYLKYEK
jgi:hypothetical protein